MPRDQAHGRRPCLAVPVLLAFIDAAGRRRSIALRGALPVAACVIGRASSAVRHTCCALHVQGSHEARRASALLRTVTPSQHLPLCRSGLDGPEDACAGRTSRHPEALANSAGKQFYLLKGTCLRQKTSDNANARQRTFPSVCMNGGKH